MSEEIVVIRNFPSEWEAVLARDFLKAAGIRASIDTAGRDLLPQLMGGKKLRRSNIECRISKVVSVPSPFDIRCSTFVISSPPKLPHFLKQQPRYRI